MPIGEDPIANYAYQVDVDGQTLAQFKEVSGLSTEISVIEHRENKPGALPVMRKVPGAQKVGDVTLKRGKTDNQGFWEWIKKVQEGKIDEARSGASIALFSYERGEVARYNLENAWPSKVNIGQLEAGGNSVLIEEVTIVHEGLTIG